MNLLVAGGCGFIGSCFIEHMLREYPGCRIINVDALTYAAHPDTVLHLENLDAKRYRFVRADIGTVGLEALMREEGVTDIVNFAAETHVDRSILNPTEFIRTNVVGVQNLLQAARNVGQIRFLQVSTDEVYGSLEPNDTAFTELSPLTPNSPYAASKASADLLALACHRTFGQDVVITRCSNNYGPYQFPEKLLPLVIANAVEDRPIPVYGDGKQVRDWIYVGDHCRGIDTVLQWADSGQVYNISAGREWHNIDLIQRVLQILGKPESLIQFVKDRPGHDRRYALDSSRLQSELHWRPNTTFEVGLERTIQWYLKNEPWWKKVRGEEYFSYYESNYRDKFQSLSEVQT